MNYNTGMHGFCYDSQGQLLNSYFTEEECCGADGSFCADGGFNVPGATLYSSARIAARSDGGAGGLHIIQVQTTGEA